MKIHACGREAIHNSESSSSRIVCVKNFVRRWELSEKLIYSGESDDGDRCCGDSIGISTCDFSLRFCSLYSLPVLTFACFGGGCRSLCSREEAPPTTRPPSTPTMAATPRYMYKVYAPREENVRTLENCWALTSNRAATLNGRTTHAMTNRPK